LQNQVAIFGEPAGDAISSTPGRVGLSGRSHSELRIPHSKGPISNSTLAQDATPFF
jgi:hypothetical protein